MVVVEVFGLIVPNECAFEVGGHNPLLAKRSVDKLAVGYRGRRSMTVLGVDVLPSIEGDRSFPQLFSVSSIETQQR